jgi:predicted RNase H-like HicB family nuclease
LETRIFLTVIETGPESFGAFAPDIQGCAAFSTSRDEVTLLFKAAAEAHLRELAKCGEELPAAETTGIPGLAIGIPSGTITLEWTAVEVPVAT